MKNLKILFALLFISVCTENIFAQSDIEKLMQTQDKVEKSPISIATFKGTRLINFHSSETLGSRVLEFRISHRFGNFNSGANNFWGLDGPATIRLALEYSHNGRLMFGLGRTSAGKLIDGFVKYRILRQTVDETMPISVTVVGSSNLTTQALLINGTSKGFEKYTYFSQRFAYMSQLIFARKFTNSLSLQFSPMYIHYNIVPQIMDRNDIFSLILSGRMKLSKRIAITAEYGFRLNNYTLDYKNYYNSASIGVDIETGGHVFQLFVTNSYSINEVLAIPYTNSSWQSGGIRLGFNITRAFASGKAKKE